MLNRHIDYKESLQLCRGGRRGRRRGEGGEGVEGKELERLLKNSTMIEKSGNAYWCI